MLFRFTGGKDSLYVGLVKTVQLLFNRNVFNYFVEFPLLILSLLLRLNCISTYQILECYSPFGGCFEVWLRSKLNGCIRQTFIQCFKISVCFSYYVQVLFTSATDLRGASAQLPSVPDHSMNSGPVKYCMKYHAASLFLESAFIARAIPKR